ncbi:hypothetical protein M0813_28132 [Anaeramoeba flamelloides]|uniref:Knr4/Smi1-like domain-containing protein n=1 Tax=Anaeramoeba flamelloides TaxID=1746091 RepID=A0ABQ8XVM5_9EUKA|nr:hypothetical protein M0813_28132 [Anaeramoeba flamelloides]
MFNDIDFTNFWSECEYSQKHYEEGEVTEEMIQKVEKELDYKLPKSYIELMKIKNGGTVKNGAHATSTRTSWSDSHIAISSIFGIGFEKTYSLCGRMGSQFWIEEWRYPAIGIYLCDCPSGGHDMVCLDYSKCGKNGEPEVVHIDQEHNYKKTFVAANFEEFVKGLKDEEEFEK